jgi:hypothetical protein
MRITGGLEWGREWGEGGGMGEEVDGWTHLLAPEILGELNTFGHGSSFRI